MQNNGENSNGTEKRSMGISPVQKLSPAREQEQDAPATHGRDARATNGNGAATKAARTVLELTVANHPGVMSHVCGLFSRRAYNVEAIICLPVGDGLKSRIWLMVNEDERLEQMVKQAGKLEDVFDVRRHAAGHEVFLRLEKFFD